MSEVDVLAVSDVDEDVVVFHEQLVEPIQLTLFAPQLATTVTPSPTITAPCMTSSLPRSCDVTRRAQRRPNVLNIASTSSLSPSFYESGTLSASVSRDHSPQRYPRPPPNMIISPAHCRSHSADRTSSSSQYNNGALQRLVKRLSDVIDVDDDVMKSDVVSSAAGRCRDNSAEHRQTAGSDVRARDLTSPESGRASRKAASNTEISPSSSLPLPSSSAAAVAATLSGTSSRPSSALSSAGGATNSRLSRWTATLALFRKKNRDKQSPSSSSSSSSTPSATAGVTAAESVTRPLQEQCASLSSGDVMASVETCSSRQVHSHLSQSQPLHNSTAASHPAPASGLLATASSSSSSRGSKLARIIDPLKLRRRPNSTSVDLQTSLMTSSAGEVTSQRAQALLAGRPVIRRARYSLTSAYMQGSL